MSFALILIVILLYYCSANKSNPRTIKNYIKFITVTLILVSGLRHEAVGNDTYSYIQNFENLMITPWSEVTADFWDLYFNPGADGKDPGERVIIKAFTEILPNARWFLFVVAALLLIPLGVLVYRNSKTLETPCFFYVFYLSFFYHYLPNSAVRQSMALTLLVIGYLFLQKDKVKYFLLFLFLATFLHKTVIIALLILPFYYSRHIKFGYLISFLLFIIMLFTYNYVGVFLSMQSDIYEGYGVGTYYAQGHSAPFLVIIMVLALYFVGVFGINKDSSAYSNRLIYGGSALTLIWVVLVRLDPSVIRLISYFGPWMGLMVSHALRQWRPRDYKLFLIIILMMFALRAIITPDNYHFLWQEMQLHERY